MACLITTLAVSGFSSFTLVQQSTHWNSLKSQCELTSITMCQDQLFRSGSSVRQLNHRPLQHHIHHDRLHQSGSDQFHCQEQGNNCLKNPSISIQDLSLYLDFFQSASEWQIVFNIAACVAAFGGVFYAIFGSGELQPWAIQDPGDIAKSKLNYCYL